MQPVQLSLIPDAHPRPATTLVEQLPAEAVAAAIVLLASVIAKAGLPVRMRVVAGDE